MMKKLQKAKFDAMKEKNVIAKKILSLLHSDALAMAKKETRELTDEDVVKCAKTLIKRNKQAIADVKRGNGDPTKLIGENTILYGYLPVQKTEEEIKNIIDEILSDVPEEGRSRKIQGKVMKQLKNEHGDSIDMGIAAKYLGTKLS